MAKKPVSKVQPWRKRLRDQLRFVYDCQALRIQVEQRLHMKAKAIMEKGEAEGADPNTEALGRYLVALYQSETIAKNELERLCETTKEISDIYQVLRSVKGIGLVGAGVCVAEFDIERAPYVSSFWQYAGLSTMEGAGTPDRKKEWEERTRLAYQSLDRMVDEEEISAEEVEELGHSLASAPRVAMRREAGQRQKDGRKGTPCNSWLKSKLLFVVGSCLLKAGKGGNKRYTAYYKAERRKKDQQLGFCMCCMGSGKAVPPKKPGDDPDVVKRPKPCWNCVDNREDEQAIVNWERKCLKIAGDAAKKGDLNPEMPPRPARKWTFPLTPRRAPWGRSAAHRHAHAVRIMVKMFVADLWTHWVTLKGLPVKKTWAEEHLGLAVSEHHHVGDLLGLEEEIIAEDLARELDGADDEEDGIDFE